MLPALSSRTGLAFWVRRLGDWEAGRSSADCPAAEPHPLTPHGPPPGKSLGQGVDFVVVTPRESKKFGREVFKPGRTLGKPHRTTREQIGLGNQARTLVGFRFDPTGPPRYAACFPCARAVSNITSVPPLASAAVRRPRAQTPLWSVGRCREGRRL